MSEHLLGGVCIPITLPFTHIDIYTGVKLKEHMFVSDAGDLEIEECPCSF